MRGIRRSWRLVGALSCTLTLALPSTRELRAQSRARVADGNEVVVRVGNRVLRRAALAERLAEEGIKAGRDSFSSDAQKDALAEVIAFELLVSAALRDGYGERADIVQFVREASVQTLLQREAKRAASTGTEEEARRRFQEDAARFAYPELRRAHFIRVETEKQAQELIRTLSGKDLRAFRQAAQQHSTDQDSKLRGGDLGYFDREGQVYTWAGGALAHAPRDMKISEALVAATFSLREPGAITRAPVPLNPGFAVLIATGHRPARNSDWEEAAPSLRQQVERARRQEAYDALVRALRKRHRMELFPERIAPIRLP